jgi:hypothetical protein
VPTLWEQLNSLYPEVLSADPSQAINGTELLEKVRRRLSEFAEDSIRQYFSLMSQDPTTSIAKITDGHGYYLRRTDSRWGDEPVAPELPRVPGGREFQLEEKFRSIYMRYSEQEQANQFPIHVEHTRAARREAGVNQWKFPDVVLLSWQLGKPAEQAYKPAEQVYRLDPNLLAVKTSLGEPPFSLRSVELKVALSLPTFREDFFQCVSNSKWAHSAELAVANKVQDDTLSRELRRLGASYDVSIVSYGLPSEFLESLPSASEILEMEAADFDGQIAGKISLARLSTSKGRASLDWDHIYDLRDQKAFPLLFEWVAHCLAQKRAYSFDEFQQIYKIEHRTG